MDRQLKILQYNVQSIKYDNNKQKLEYFLNQNKIDIALIQETWLTNNAYASLADYVFPHRGRQDGYGGVGIYIKRDIKFAILNVPSELECIAITTLNLASNTNFINVYCAPNIPINTFKNEIEKIFTFAASLKGKTLIGGDFNAKSTSWGNPQTNNRGYAVEIAHIGADFRCINTGDNTHATPRCTSAIDLTFISSNTINVNWIFIDESITGSHHKPIIITLDKNHIIHHTTKMVMHKRITADIQKLELKDDINDITAQFNQIIHQNTIAIGDKNTYSPKRWWSEETKTFWKKQEPS